MADNMDLDTDVQASSRGQKRKADSVLEAAGPKRIHQLAEDVVNKIAAGEIIVAPQHALKELIENAVDAGATSVEILAKDGGLKLLQISDNGCGIEREDMAILCERFTTSKLRTFEDLQAMSTYGFRGEALASISHVAHLTVTTKTQASSCAWKAHYADGRLAPPKPGQPAEPKACAGRGGTQVTVEDLFYNVPTRRRAFRSPSEEYAKILEMVGKYAVHCDNVAFSCKKHGDASTSLSVQANASLVDRIRLIHGVGVAAELVRVECESERWGFKAQGHFSNANYSGKRMTLLLFINHRAVESTPIKKAIEQTYAGFLPKGGHPFAYLSLGIDPKRIDVNVHPTKREVRFLNEDEIISMVCDELSINLGKVDTSRTFMTQTLLPSSHIPTIRASLSRGESNGDEDVPSHGVQSATRPASNSNKPHESNMVRVDSRTRKITSMLPPALSRDPTAPETQDGQDFDTDVIEYEHCDREAVLCKLTSIKELRSEVRDAMHDGLSDVFASLIFVGIVDERRRMAAVQSGVKLYLVDYGAVANEYFYQLGLTDFGNFGRIRLDPPLPLDELLRLGVEQEMMAARKGDGVGEGVDWDAVVRRVKEQILSRREMLEEYFGLEVSADGQLCSLPLLVKGYVPSMAKLPRFLLRLGPYVEWKDERGCFKSFLRELASWYTPEQLPSMPVAPPMTETAAGAGKTAAGAGKTAGGGGFDGADASISLQQEGQDGDGNANGNGDDEEGQDDAMVSTPKVEDPRIVARRRQVNAAVEHVLFPAFRARLVATRGLLPSVIEVANLKGLYRVFERC